MVAPELLTQLQDDWKQLGSSRRDAFTQALRDHVQKRRKVLPFRPRTAPTTDDTRQG